MLSWTKLCAATALVLLSPTAATAAVLTDITVLSTNAFGTMWNNLIWNTQGKPEDGPDRWNLYVSSDPTSDPTPAFINSMNDGHARVSLPLAVGSNMYSIYGDGVNFAFDSQQHFVLNLYFGGTQSAPGISGVQNLTHDDLQAAGSPNGWDVFGTPNTWQPEAGTLSTLIDNQMITLSAFSWITGEQRDVVKPDDTMPNGRADYYGSFTIAVANVPEPATLALLGIALAGLGFSRRQLH